MKRKEYNNQNTSFALLNWMVSNLGLKNYELLIYALIYSFTRIEGSLYRSSIAYICERIHVSKSTVIRALNSLVEKKLLLKTCHTKNGVKYVTYKHSQEMLKKAGLSGDSRQFEGSFFTIYDWMINNLNLSGHSLTVYALLYSFSKGPNRCFKGNMTYICKRLNMSTKQVKRMMDKLIEHGYLVEISKYNPRSKCAVYRTRDCEELEDYYRCSYEQETSTDDSRPQSVSDANCDEISTLPTHNETQNTVRHDSPHMLQNSNAVEHNFATEFSENEKEDTYIPAVLKNIFAKINSVLTKPERQFLDFLCSKIVLT